VLALRESHRAIAARLIAGDDYPDFFVEGSAPPWHERWPEVVGSGREPSQDRMTFVDRLRQDDYPDFFVEGSGPPWHERWPEVAKGERFDSGNIQHRIRAINGLDVMQAFFRLRESTRK